MLPGGIVASIVATYHTIINQRRCKHDYREDEFTTNGVSTQTCIKCWKRIKIKL